MDGPWKYHAKLKKQATKDHMLYDFIYKKCPDWENPWRQDSILVVACILGVGVRSDF